MDSASIGHAHLSRRHLSPPWMHVVCRTTLVCLRPPITRLCQVLRALVWATSPLTPQRVMAPSATARSSMTSPTIRSNRPTSRRQPYCRSTAPRTTHSCSCSCSTSRPSRPQTPPSRAAAPPVCALARPETRLSVGGGSPHYSCAGRIYFTAPSSRSISIRLCRACTYVCCSVHGTLQSACLDARAWVLQDRHVTQCAVCRGSVGTNTKLMYTQSAEGPTP